jgi:putative transposase
MDRTFFVTSVTAQRKTIFQREAAANLFVEILFDYRDQGKFLLHEFVLMPDHFHLLVTPSDLISLEKAVQFLKGGFSFRVKSRFPVWQPSFIRRNVKQQPFRGKRCSQRRPEGREHVAPREAFRPGVHFR